MAATGKMAKAGIEAGLSFCGHVRIVNALAPPIE